MVAFAAKRKDTCRMKVTAASRSFVRASVRTIQPKRLATLDAVSRAQPFLVQALRLRLHRPAPRRDES